MSFVSTDYSQSYPYDFIFQHYGFEERVPYMYKDSSVERKHHFVERNDNTPTKKINAKTVTKTDKKKKVKHTPGKSKHSPHHKSKLKKKDQDKVIKIPVPNAAKSRKTSYTSSKTTSNRNRKSPKPKPSAPAVEMHAASDSTIKTAQKLPSYHSQTSQSSLNKKPNPNQLLPPQTRSHRSDTSKPVSTPVKSTKSREHMYDLDEINTFTRDIFKFKHGARHKPKNHPYRIRLICPQDENLEDYIKSRFNCVDIFNDYVNDLKKQHGVVRKAADDPPNFDPGITITGPQVKKDPELIDKEDSQVIQKIKKMEPRKKYALVHENVGIFIIGGYNLFVDVPVQKEPQTDYLFKSNGAVVRIPTLHPSRCNFAVYADGQAIYVAGGQTIDNELLDDIQRLNIDTLKWEHVATLLNAVAASGMTIENNRIYLVGGYDVILSQTTFLEDYIIYNLSTEQFEKATDLPSPRCRSLVFATDNAIFCVSGLTERPNDDKNRKINISTDILKWSHENPEWIKVSQTPELSKYHALSFNDPYLEVTKRSIDDPNNAGDFITEAYYDFRTNLWANGKAPEHHKKIPPPQSETEHSASEKPSKSAVAPSPSKHKSHSKPKSSTKSKKHKKPAKGKVKIKKPK